MIKKNFSLPENTKNKSENSIWLQKSLQISLTSLRLCWLINNIVNNNDIKNNNNNKACILSNSETSKNNNSNHIWLQKGQDKHNFDHKNSIVQNWLFELFDKNYCT